MFKKAFVLSCSLLAAACGSDADVNLSGTGGEAGTGAVAGGGGTSGNAGSGGAAGAAASGGAAGSAGGGGSAGTAGGGGSAGSGGAASGLLITEIMVNPKAVDDNVGEYIELHNSTASTVSLKGYKLHDGFNNSHVIYTELSVPAGGYLVLARDGDPKKNGGVFADYVYDNFFLANTSDAVYLEDSAGKLVAGVKYGNGWPTGDGAALELVDVALDPAQPGNWKLANNRFGTGDLGTPGGPNGYGPAPYQLDAGDLGWQDCIV